MPSHIDCSHQTVDQVRLYARLLLTLLDHYKELADSYVVEFFVKSRWELLPESWRVALHGRLPEELSRLLLDQRPPEEFPSVWPLSLLSYRAATHALALDPTPALESEIRPAHQNPTSKPIDLLCRLHVKAKKRHEILRMAEVIKSATVLTASDKVVDVGSGHGHLSRLLSFGHDLDVISIEAVGCHLTAAVKADTKIKTIMQKRAASQPSNSVDHLHVHVPETPQHVECTLHPHVTVEEFVNVINRQSRNEREHAGQCTPENEGSATGQTYMGLGDAGCLVRDKERGDRIQVHGASGKGVNILETESTFSETTPNKAKMDTSFVPAGDSVKSNGTSGRGVTALETTRKEMPPNEAKMDSSFVLAGLHTCGDLAPTMLRVFAKCSQARALTSVACCYMKMDCAIPLTSGDPLQTTLRQDGHGQLSEYSARSKVRPHVQQSNTSEDICGIGQTRKSDGVQENDERTCSGMSDGVGYPMSQWVKGLGGKGLQFEALELACHSIHSYNKRLKAKDPTLILHGYRCALEVLIQEADREMTQHHAGVCRIKKAVAAIRRPHLKSFEEYAATALTSLGLLSDERHLAEIKEKYLPLSNNVIAFHILRSLLGPVLESLLLVDRVLYLYEQGVESRLVPVFDAAISPRNFALVAVKR